MKTNLKVSLVAGLLLAAGVAYSQAPMDCPAGMAGMGGPGMAHSNMGNRSAAKMQLMMEKRQAALKAQLKLTPEQEPAWTTFIASHKPPAEKMGNHPAMADMSKLTTPERIEKMKEMRGQRMAEMSTSMEQRNEATMAFYNVLTADQKKVFDNHEMAGPGGRAAMRGKRPQMPASK
jgi:hypothetical protein